MYSPTCVVENASQVGLALDKTALPAGLGFCSFQETAASRKAAHREGKIKLKQEKQAREAVAKKVRDI